MASRKSLFIVSFGDSRKYRTSSGDKIKSVADTLRDMLVPEYPDTKITGYLIPAVEEVSGQDADQYGDLPKLDKDAVTEIAGVLRCEIENMVSQKELDLNAPFNDINSSAVDPGQI